MEEKKEQKIHMAATRRNFFWGQKWKLNPLRPIPSVIQKEKSLTWQYLSKSGWQNFSFGQSCYRAKNHILAWFGVFTLHKGYVGLIRRTKNWIRPKGRKSTDTAERKFWGELEKEGLQQQLSSKICKVLDD
jgi:hypothetical protein